MGKVDDGNTVSDWDPEEIKRRISIGTSLIPCEWQDHKVNVLDTPGYFDFVGEVQGALHAADAMLCVVCAASGVQAGTEKVWEMGTSSGPSASCGKGAATTWFPCRCPSARRTASAGSSTWSPCRPIPARVTSWPPARCPKMCGARWKPCGTG